MTEVFESFYGVYLLYNVGEKYRGRTYIGFTTNPDRRLSQHNKGVHSGGAKKTDSKGQWEMVLIVHGFPNEISALRFEWAWQNPKKSRRLQHLPLKKPREKMYDFAIRTLMEMLRIGPWNRLPITVRLSNDSFSGKLSETILLPFHITIVNKPISTQKRSFNAFNEADRSSNCHRICYNCKTSVADDIMTCMNPECELISHITCLSVHFLRDTDHLIPIQSYCPLCYTRLFWGDLVSKTKKVINANQKRYQARD